MPGLSNSNNLDIVVRTQADTKGLKEAQGAVGQLSNETEKSSHFAGLASIAHTAFGVAAGIALQQAAFKAVDFAKSTVASFEVSQNMIAQTNAVLKSTGGIAGVTADAVDKLSKSLEHQTKFSDEDVRSVENMLLTFTAIHKDVFPQATKTVLNMATALGEDTKSASIQLGKALQDPILGITALRRVGVNFTDDQKKVIQGLVDTGQSAKAQQLILKELNTEFGGSAVAAGNTFAGNMAKLKNRIDDMKESVGGFIVNEGLKFFNLLQKWGENNRVQQWLGDMRQGFHDVAIFAGLLWQTLSGGDPTIKKGQEGFAGIAKALSKMQDILQQVEKYTKELFMQTIKAVKIAFEALLPSIDALWKTLDKQLLPSLVKLWKAFGPDIMKILKDAAAVFGVTLYLAIWTVTNVINLLMKVLSPLFSWMASHKQIVIDLAIAFGILAIALKFNDIKASFIGNMEQIMSKIGAVKSSVGGLFAKISGGTAMGGIAVAGALADIALVAQAVQTVMGAINAMNNAKQAIVNKNASDLAVIAQLGKTIRTGTPDQQARAKQVLDRYQSTGHFATGITNFAGGMAWVGEHGPELVELPRGSRVLTNSQSQAMAPASSTQNTFTGNIILGSASAVTEFFKQINQDALLAGKGLSVRQGA